MRGMLRMAVLAAAALLMSACASVATTGPAATGGYNRGDWVLARWQEDQVFYWPAIVTSASGGQVTLQYDDGDVGTQHVSNVRPFDWGPGTRLECRWQNGPTWYPGRIAEMAADRYNIFVHYDDGDQEATNTSLCRARG